MSVFDYTSSSVEEFRARQARTRLYCTECESSVSFFLREKGVGLGSVFDCTSSSVEEFRARQARTRLDCNECESSVSFYKRVRTLAVGEESTFWRGRTPVGESAPLWGRARPFGGGCAPLGEGVRLPLHPTTRPLKNSSNG
jgi:hypothetical protein